MRKALATLLAAGAVGFLTAAASDKSDKATGPNGPYELVKDWPQMAHPYPRAGYVFGSQGGIFVESPNRIFLANRGELKLPDKLPPGFDGFYTSLGEKIGAAENVYADIRNCIMVVDGNGKLLESWTQWDHLFTGARGPHSIKISPYDPERHVWVVNDYYHQIYEFTNDGQNLVRTLGERDVPGNDQTHFHQPTDIAFLPDGTFFVSDGVGNARIVKFDKNGNYLMSWGKPGTGPGEFNTLHAIAVGPDRHVYVSDRGNNRIQIFDENGKFIAQWPFRTQSLMFTADGHLWFPIMGSEKYVEYDLNGNMLSSFELPAKTVTAHQLSADAQGNMYGAGEAGQPFKLRPKPGSDQSKLMHPVALAGKDASTAPGTAVYNGTWKLASSDPAVPVRRNPKEEFGAIAPTVTIMQTPTDVTFINGTTKLIYRLDGSETTNPNFVDPASGAPAITTARWKDGKLVLTMKQRLRQYTDTLSLDGGKLDIARDINSIGESYDIAMIYAK